MRGNFFLWIVISLLALSGCSKNENSVSANAFSTASHAYKTAYVDHITRNGSYILVDYTKPSTVKRLYVIANNKVIYSTYVAHGIGSGTGQYVNRLSNVPESKTSSIGVSQVVGFYYGVHGYSARLNGLDKGFNDNMYNRDIVMHYANYVGKGKTGHSWGCFAVPDKDSLFKYVSVGMIIVAYYPDSSWLHSSKFLR